MKKIVICIIVVLLPLGTSLFAFDMGISFLFNYNLIMENGNFKADLTNFSEISYLGIFFDVPIVDRIGFRFSGSVKFTEVPLDQSVWYRYNKNIHWDGTIGPSIHLFGESQLDPYIQLGAGSAGGVFQDAARYNDPRTRTQIVIFFHGIAGVNLTIWEIFLVGLNIRVIPYSFNPSGLVTYQQFPIAGNLMVGFRI